MSEKPKDGYPWAKERGFWHGRWFVPLVNGESVQEGDEFRSKAYPESGWKQFGAMAAGQVLPHAVLRDIDRRRPVSVRPDAEILEAMRSTVIVTEQRLPVHFWTNPVTGEKTDKVGAATGWLPALFPEQGGTQEKPPVDPPNPFRCEPDQPQCFLIHFDDQDRGPEIITDEAAAHRTYALRRMNWTCRLFAEVMQPIPAPAEEGESLVSILNDVIDDRGGQIVELTRKLSALTAKLAAAEGEVARLRVSCDHVSEVAAGRWVTMGKLADQVRDLTAERDAARKEAEGLRGELEAARNPKPSKTLCLPAMFHVVCDSCGKSFPRETHKQFDPCPECTQPGGTL